MRQRENLAFMFMIRSVNSIFVRSRYDSRLIYKQVSIPLCVRTYIPHTCYLAEWYDTTRNGACIRSAHIPHLGILCPLAVIDSPGLPTPPAVFPPRTVQ